jgi:hypothetical protein
MRAKANAELMSLSFIIPLPGVNVIKLFTAVNFRIFRKKARVFVLGKHFQSSLLFAGKAGTYLCDALLSVLHHRWASELRPQTLD